MTKSKMKCEALLMYKHDFSMVSSTHDGLSRLGVYRKWYITSSSPAFILVHYPTSSKNTNERTLVAALASFAPSNPSYPSGSPTSPTKSLSSSTADAAKTSTRPNHRGMAPLTVHTSARLFHTYCSLSTRT
jgi:hypothetical protein